METKWKVLFALLGLAAVGAVGYLIYRGKRKDDLANAFGAPMAGADVTRGVDAAKAAGKWGKANTLKYAGRGDPDGSAKDWIEFMEWLQDEDNIRDRIDGWQLYFRSLGKAEREQWVHDWPEKIGMGGSVATAKLEAIMWQIFIDGGKKFGFDNKNWGKIYNRFQAEILFGSK